MVCGGRSGRTREFPPVECLATNRIIRNTHNQVVGIRTPQSDDSVRMNWRCCVGHNANPTASLCRVIKNQLIEAVDAFGRILSTRQKSENLS